MAPFGAGGGELGQGHAGQPDGGASGLEQAAEQGKCGFVDRTIGRYRVGESVVGLAGLKIVVADFHAYRFCLHPLIAKVGSNTSAEVKKSFLEFPDARDVPGKGYFVAERFVGPARVDT